ncbi:MAG: sulfur oxidation c-type cytochrome SoxX [Gammaproteobacteria bacterium]|nr:sulfur oxidation c-type cytochrome SoxX [Gammaproteobacteria bacterium]
MFIRIRLFVSSVSIAILLGLGLGLASVAEVNAAGYMSKAQKIAAGKVLSYARKKGNCLGCHVMDDGELPGNIGPPLVGMKARYPDKAKLRQQIYDATMANINTIMPPFGRHRILTVKELDLVTEYIYSL